MHDLNKDTQVLIFGNSEFVKSMNEISNYLNFKINLKIGLNKQRFYF